MKKDVLISLFFVVLGSRGVYIVVDTENNDKIMYDMNPIIETGDSIEVTGDGVVYVIDAQELLTGEYITGYVKKEQGEQSLIIMSGYNARGQKSRPIGDYPLVNIKAGTTGLSLELDVKFTEEFVNKYKYEDSKGYGFALKVFIDEPANSYFYDVYRKLNGGVANDRSRGLLGWVSAFQINNHNTWQVPLNDKVNVAVPTSKVEPGKQYKSHIFIGADTKEDDIKAQIGAYLSSTKEIKGRELTHIDTMSIKWRGYDDDVVLIE